MELSFPFLRLHSHLQLFRLQGLQYPLYVKDRKRWLILLLSDKLNEFYIELITLSLQKLHNILVLGVRSPIAEKDRGVDNENETTKNCIYI